MAESPSASSLETFDDDDDNMSMRIRCSISKLPFGASDEDSSASSITEVSTGTNKISNSVDAIEKIGKVIPSNQAYNDILLLGGGEEEDYNDEEDEATEVEEKGEEK